jgi:V/A-type H+-transporting ATPase subunit E
VKENEKIMTGLSKITDKILDEARRDAAATLAQADAESARIAAEYKARAADIESHLNAQARARAEEVVSRTRSGEATARKNILLKTRGEMIDRAFEVAEKELNALSGDARLELLEGLLTAAMSAEWEAEQSRTEIYGDDIAQEGERVYEVLLNPKDREHLGDKVISNFKRRIVGKDMKDIAARVRLAKDTADIEGGLVIRVGSVEINASISSIIADLRPTLEARIEKILFP